MARLIGKIPVRNELGEGIFWNSTDQAFWWTDIEGKKVYRFHMETNKLEDFETPYRLAAFAPRQNEQSFVAAFESGFAVYDPRSGALDWINQPDLPANVRFNDGRIDRQGRFWCGTMVEDGNGDAGELYCLEPSHSVRKVTNGIGISNGLAFSPDGATMYFADSTQQKVWAFDYDASTGEPKNKRDYISTDGKSGPDGATVDANGNYWSATWGAWRVNAYDPAGGLLMEVPVQTPNVSCVAFGGPNMNVMAVTSAQHTLTDAQRNADPNAGHVFVYQTNYQGLPEPAFAG